MMTQFNLLSIVIAMMMGDMIGREPMTVQQ